MTTHNANLNLWDQLKRVPPEHLKGFQRAGGFKGTAIKPMWTIQKVTEVLGPIGTAWGIGEPIFETVTAGEEILVYCTVQVWVGEPHGAGFWGVGGDKVRAVFSNGPKNDDEAFKKAYTDALTNALKLLGAGADVHMGLWDGNKYVDEKPEPANEQHDRAPHIPEAPPQEPPAKLYEANQIVRDEFDRIVKGIREAAEFGTISDLSMFWKNNQKSIGAMPAKYFKELTREKDEAKAALEAKAA
jgi:hypothetical protein